MLPGTISADVAWADMDGDGRLDLVISATNHFDSSFDDGAWGIYVYRYVGGIDPFTFHDYGATTFPVRGLTLADFDHDGDIDVAAAVDIFDNNFDRDSISVLKNDGTGHLEPEVLHNLGSANESATLEVVSGTFDRSPGSNTLPDLFTGRWDENDAASMTNLDGTNFEITLVTPDPCAEWWFSDIVVDRFTTGKLIDDVAGISAGDDGLLHILHGDGNAGFNHDCSGGSSDDVYLDELGPRNFLLRGIASGHLNAGGSNKPDLLVADYHGVIFLLGKGDGTFQFDKFNSLYFPNIGSIDGPTMRATIADLDQDGFGDIITSNHGGHLQDGGTISVLINKFQLIAIP